MTLTQRSPAARLAAARAVASGFSASPARAPRLRLVEVRQVPLAATSVGDPALGLRVCLLVCGAFWGALALLLLV